MRYDRELKADLYAKFAVPELWVIDLRASRVHVYRAPLNGAYASIETVEFGRLRIAALPSIEVDLAPLAG